MGWGLSSATLPTTPPTPLSSPPPFPAGFQLCHQRAPAGFQLHSRAACPHPGTGLGTSSWSCLGWQRRGRGRLGSAGVAVVSHLSMLRAQRLSTVMPTEAFWIKGTSLQTCTPKGQSLARSWGGATGYQAALGIVLPAPRGSRGSPTGCGEPTESRGSSLRFPPLGMFHGHSPMVCWLWETLVSLSGHRDEGWSRHQLLTPDPGGLEWI